MPQVGFESTISAGELPQTYTLDREATGTGCKIVGLDASGSALEPVTVFYEKIKKHPVTLKQYIPQETQIINPNTAKTTNTEVQNLGWLIK